MKITSLLENTTARPDMHTEHGLSLYIETENHRILFDMGQSDMFYKNALALGIDLAEVDFAVVSHGHYDHGGGLGHFLKINNKAPVYIHKDAFLPHYNGRTKYIGLDHTYKENERLILTSDICKIDEGITLLSGNSKERKMSFGSFGLTELTASGYTDDDFRHEQYLFLEESDRRVLISGCSHKGILDIISWFKSDVLIGGFHFSKMELGSELEKAARILDSHPTKYYTCHCTGVEQFNFMKKYVSSLHYLSCGESIEI